MKVFSIIFQEVLDFKICVYVCVCVHIYIIYVISEYLEVQACASNAGFPFYINTHTHTQNTN